MLLLSPSRAGCAMLSGRGRSRRDKDKAPAASHQQRLGSALLASPVHFRPHRGLHDYSSERLHPSSALPGAPHEVCSPLQRGGEQAAGQGRVGRQQTPPHLFRFEPCGTSLRTERSGGSCPRTGERGGRPSIFSRGASPGRCPLPPAARNASFCCSPSLPLAALQRHKAQLPAVPRCHEMHQVEIQSPRCVCGRNLWQLLWNFL